MEILLVGERDVPQTPELEPQLLRLQSLRHQRQQLVVLERFLDEPEGARAHRLDRGLELPERGHDDDRHLGLDALDLAQQLEAGPVRKLQVQDREVGHVPLDRLAGLAHRRGGLDGVAVLLQRLAHEVSDGILVVDH